MRRAVPHARRSTEGRVTTCNLEGWNGKDLGPGDSVSWLPNMRMQLTRPRVRWPAAERWTSASLQLIRGR
jgi:hypothetical protein